MAPLTQVKKCAFYQPRVAQQGTQESHEQLLKRYLKRRAEIQSELDAQNMLWFRMNRHRYTKREEVIDKRIERFSLAFSSFLGSNRMFQQLKQLDEKIAWLETRRSDVKGQTPIVK